MSKGVLLFAFNTEMDYVKLAIKLTERIRHYLNLPVTVVTDSQQYLQNNFNKSFDLFDSVIQQTDNTKQTKKFSDGTNKSERYVWKNSNRFNAYSLSPYDKTLVLDVDYVINSDFLLHLFNTTNDFYCFKNSYDLSGWRNTAEFEYVNQYSIPFYWATVFYFTKTFKNELLFSLIEYIKDNWEYYRLLYQISDKKFRNDYAFSIAIHILHGTDHDLFDGIIPAKMYYTLDKDILLKLNKNSMTFLVEKEKELGNYVGIKTTELDVHVMNKFSLLRAYDE